MTDNKFNYNWTLQDANFTKDKGKVFSCFSCGGGSTMGYKLAGFDVIGCNEVDQRMMDVYLKNNDVKYQFVAPIQEFKNYDFPSELYNLDILDGSPPCSPFSMVGNREKDWGKKKKFKEGQVAQVIDTLFFDFIELGKKLQPKVIIAENVKGLLVGKAKAYVERIYEEFEKAGYCVQHFLLDSSTMGVPQKRERVFFIAIRKDLATKLIEKEGSMNNVPYIDLVFNEKQIPAGEITDFKGREIVGEKTRFLWDNRKYGDKRQQEANMRLFGIYRGFGQSYVYQDKVISTLTTKEDSLLHFERPRYLSKDEVCKISTFPLDYDFNNRSFHYVCGMAVPPVMIAQIASRIYEQWLSKLNN